MKKILIEIHKEISDIKMAKMMGVDPATIWRWRTGKTSKISFDDAQKIMKIYKKLYG